MIYPGNINQLKDNKKILEDVKGLYMKPCSEGLGQYLDSLATEKPRTVDVFILGLAKFIEIANLFPEKRGVFYGSLLGGLHYLTTFVTLLKEMYGESVSYAQLGDFVPPGWMGYYGFAEGGFTLTYHGHTPSIALDKLLQGPSIIDCGMFCQLSILFGMRYMLGNALFDILFGKMPLHVTMRLYNPISEPPYFYLGNPLYSFFEPESFEEMDPENIYVTHLRNHQLYALKHPGGVSIGENCLVFNGKYNIFLRKLHLTKHEVEMFLMNDFNAEQDMHDQYFQSTYEGNGERFYSKFQMKGKEIVERSKNLASFTVDENAWRENLREGRLCKMKFNFKKYCEWVSAQKNSDAIALEYLPLDREQHRVPDTLMEFIPKSLWMISFASFQTNTSIKREILTLSKKFCDYATKRRPVFMVLAGEPGIGKRAAAVCCMKELVSRGLNVSWISEASLGAWGWYAVSETMKRLRLPLEKHRDAIFKCISTANPDVVLMDIPLEDPLEKMFFEEAFRWYTENPGKGMLVLSHHKITWETYYGFKDEECYEVHPICDYLSEHYQNMFIVGGISNQWVRDAVVKRDHTDNTESSAPRNTVFFMNKDSAVASHHNHRNERCTIL